MENILHPRKEEEDEEEEEERARRMREKKTESDEADDERPQTSPRGKPGDGKDSDVTTTNAIGESASSQSILEAMERMLRTMNATNNNNGHHHHHRNNNSVNNNRIEQQKKEHKFWSTQPVMQFDSVSNDDDDDDVGRNTTRVISRRSANLVGRNSGDSTDDTMTTAKNDDNDDGYEDNNDDGAIEQKRAVEDVRTKGFDLPPGYIWDEVDVDTQTGRDEIFELLANNYVEDDDEMFRFAYAPEFVKWALRPPGWEKSWHVGVRISCTGTLVALITGIPAKLKANDHRLEIAEINFLCVHKKLRRKNFAPVLIQEITRRINLKNVWQAAYTAGVVLPKPCAKARYWHRSINVKKLVDIRFTQLGRGMTMAETIEHYAMPKKIRIKGLRSMEEKDVKTVTKLLNAYFEKFKLAPIKTEEDVRHWLVPREDVVYSYVKIDERTNEATDFCSFYNLSSTVIQHSQTGADSKSSLLKAAYCYYNVATSENIEDLVQDALVLARDLGFDVFNALNVSENDKFLDSLKFGVGDGDLHYYLYNWRICDTLLPKDVALVLL